MKISDLSMDHLLDCHEPYHVAIDQWTDAADRRLCELSVDGSLVRDLESLCAAFSYATGIRIQPNGDALDDVMQDAHWVTRSETPKPTVVVIRNAQALQKTGYGARDFMSLGNSWAAAWAAGDETGSPTPLHFVHVIGPDHDRINRLPRLVVTEVTG